MPFLCACLSEAEDRVLALQRRGSCTLLGCLIARTFYAPMHLFALRFGTLAQLLTLTLVMIITMILVVTLGFFNDAKYQRVIKVLLLRRGSYFNLQYVQYDEKQYKQLLTGRVYCVNFL